MTFDGFDPEREFYDLKTQDGLKRLVEDLTPLVGYELWDEFDNAENGQILREAFGDRVSLSEAKNIFDRLRRTNRILSNDDREEAEATEELETAVDDRPRGADGHLLSEHEIFYNTQPALAIRERIKTDRAFAEFARAQMAGEVVLADGAEPSKSTTLAEQQLAEEAHPALRKFARQYAESAAAQLKPVVGFVTVADGTRFTLQKFNQLVAEASAAKLL
jgi:hypothetical protein